MIIDPRVSGSDVNVDNCGKDLNNDVNRIYIQTTKFFLICKINLHCLFNKKHRGIIKVRTVKSIKGLDPEMKFSSFLKKIPQNGKDNNKTIDKILHVKKSNPDCLNSQLNSGQTGNDANNSLKDKLFECNNMEPLKEECEINQNDVQYYEREISSEEELNLRTALSNHFMFRDLNEEIM